MPIRLIDLIARVPEQVRLSVRRVRDQSRSVIQEALRTECRMAMRTPEETENNQPGAQVSVEVAPGHPSRLSNISFPDDYDRIMTLCRHRSSLEQTRTGINGMLELHADFSQRSEPSRWIKVTALELESVKNWADELLRLLDRHDPLKTLLAIREDILGVYEYDLTNKSGDQFYVNRASIRLYWGVIGLVAEWMGCSVEDLSIVVLTHELSHAYTQLGADIDGRRWSAISFSKAERGLVEGLAQYYTDRVLNRLARRYPGALKTYKAMLSAQPSEYKTHVAWIESYSPESVRRAMLEVRRWNEGKLERFNERLANAQRGLTPEDGRSEEEL